MVGQLGPSFGYFVNPKKTWLPFQITTEGRPVLGSPIGKPEFISEFVRTQWTAEIEKLSDSQPHAAYGAITHGLPLKNYPRY